MSSLKVTLEFDIEREYGKRPKLQLKTPNTCTEPSVCGAYAHSFYCNHVCQELSRILGVKYILANAELED